MGGDCLSYPILYESNETDFFSLGLGPIRTAVEAFVTEERNGIFVFEGEVIVDDEIYPLLQENRIIKVDASSRLTDQRFRIKRIVPAHDGKATIYAEHVSYLTQELAMRPEVHIHGDASMALNAWKSSIIGNHPFIVDSDIQTISETTWRIDEVENPRQALGGVQGSILDKWGGEYRFDNYHISLLKKRGTTADTILAYGRNITDFEQERNITTTYTSLYPYAIYTNDNGNEQIITVDGYIVDCENISKYPNRNVLPIDFSTEFEQNEIPSKSKLLSLAKQYIKNNEIGIPKTSIKVSFLDLSQTADYKDIAMLESVELCDDVRVYYEKLGVDTIAKVVRVKWNVLREAYDEIEIGEKRTTLSTIISDTQTSIKEIQTKTGTILNAANGKNMIFYGLFGSDGLGQPRATRIGDMWYKPNGEDTDFYIWNGTIWEFIMTTGKFNEIDQAIEETTRSVEETKQNIETIHSQVRQAVDDAEFTKDNLQRVERHSLDALNQANLIFEQEQQILGDLSNVQEQTVTIKRITDELKGQLEQKVSEVSYDQLREQVQRQSVLIQQTSESLLIKADQSTVDRIDQRVAVQSANYEYLSSGMSSLITKTDGMKTEILELNSTAQRIQNSLSEQVNGITSKLTQTEQNLNGIQTTVYHQLQSIQSQQTQLANQYTSVIETIGTTESWDFSEGLWEAGSINDQGQLINQSGSIRTKNYIPVQQYDNLRTVTLEGKQIASTFYLYDENKRFIEKQANYINTIIWGKAAFIKVVLNNLSNDAVLTDYAVIKSSTAQKPVRSIRSQLLQLSDRFNFTIQKGEIIAQINHELGKTLIQNNKIILDAENVELTGNAFIPSAFIKDLRVDAATIYGTLNAASVRVINVDASSLTSGYINSNRIQSRSITADKLSVDAIQVGFNSYSNVIKINPSYLEFYNSNLLAGRLSSEGMEFWHYKTKIGFLGESYKVGQESIKGISMHLENTGDYITFGFRKTADASSFTSMLTLDPKGYFTGRKGIHFNEDVHLTRVRPGYEDASYLRFGVVGYKGSKYSALIYDSAQTGIMFGNRELYILIDSSVYPFSDVINFINRLKGKGIVYLPKEIYSDGTIKTYTTVTL